MTRDTCDMRNCDGQPDTNTAQVRTRSGYADQALHTFKVDLQYHLKWEDSSLKSASNLSCKPLKPSRSKKGKGFLLERKRHKRYTLERRPPVWHQPALKKSGVASSSPVKVREHTVESGARGQKHMIESQSTHRIIDHDRIKEHVIES